MARLTLEALERRDLLSANPLAQSIAPPAPVAHLVIDMTDVFVSSYQTGGGLAPPTPQAHLTINLENTMVSSFSSLHQHVQPTTGQPMMDFSWGVTNPGY